MSTPAPEVLPELLTVDDPRVRACTGGGVDHDYRPYTYRPRGMIAILPAVGNPFAPTAAELTAGVQIGEGVFDGPGIVKEKTFLRCVWCHAVTCGSPDETDPCIEPHHHRVPHRTRLGITWPVGGTRPNP